MYKDAFGGTLISEAQMCVYALNKNNVIEKGIFCQNRMSSGAEKQL